MIKLEIPNSLVKQMVTYFYETMQCNDNQYIVIIVLLSFYFN